MHVLNTFSPYVCCNHKFILYKCRRVSAYRNRRVAYYIRAITYSSRIVSVPCKGKRTWHVQYSSWATSCVFRDLCETRTSYMYLVVSSVWRIVLSSRVSCFLHGFSHMFSTHISCMYVMKKSRTRWVQDEGSHRQCCSWAVLYIYLTCKNICDRIWERHLPHAFINI